jgi:hypothetical protein
MKCVSGHDPDLRAMVQVQGSFFITGSDTGSSNPDPSFQNYSFGNPNRGWKRKPRPSGGNSPHHLPRRVTVNFPHIYRGELQLIPRNIYHGELQLIPFIIYGEESQLTPRIIYCGESQLTPRKSTAGSHS